tara:strand:+ start:154 stop:651 length:498 start_codon:yes stop_codon:yes gene_type:complete
MNNSEYICPVPRDQRPLNEYKKLKESSGFFKCIQDKNTYFKYLSYISLVSFLFSLLLLKVSSFSVNDSKYLLICSTVGTIFITKFLCLRYYLGWQYIYSRLMEATVSYEESGWYDGQVWVKPPEILLQDRLVGTYEIYPGLLRLQSTLVFLLVLFLASITLAKNT